MVHNSVQRTIPVKVKINERVMGRNFFFLGRKGKIVLAVSVEIFILVENLPPLRKNHGLIKR